MILSGCWFKQRFQRIVGKEYGNIGGERERKKLQSKNGIAPNYPVLNEWIKMNVKMA